MTDTTMAPAKPAWWFWLVCALGVLWNAYGAIDFAMSMIQGDAWYRMNHMSDADIAYFHAYPAWMYVVWFAGTWGALIGTVLMIFRSRWAYPAFIVSFVGFLLSLVYAYLLSGQPALVKGALPLHISIFVGCVFFIWFSQRMTKKGVLR